jgi:hypothetical protein
MKIINCSLIPDLTLAAEKACALLKPDSKMIAELGMKDDWEYNSGVGVYVGVKMAQKPDEPLRLLSYRPKNPLSNTIGYRRAGTDMAFINLYRLKTLSFKDLVAWTLHEYSHYRGFLHGTGWFANYKTKHKCQYSVPYYISENIGRWL